MDSKDFKDFMSNVPNCVSIISVFNGKEYQACTVSSFISIDVEVPKTLLVLRNESRTLSSIMRSKFYSVNLLSQDQNDVANYFSTTSTQLITNVDSLFEKETKYESPYLKECLQVCFCELERVIELENASLIIGTVLGGTSQQKKMPLIYWSRMYYSLDPSREAKS